MDVLIKKDSVKNIMEIKLTCGFIDIWRIGNRKKRKFTWLATKYTSYLATLGLLVN